MTFEIGNKLRKGRPCSIKTREKISNSSKGRIPWNKGLNKETDLRIKKYGEALKGRPCSVETREKISNSEKGKIVSKKTREKMSNSRTGEKNPSWKDGKSFEPYTNEFNRQSKELIRYRDGYKCQKCGCPEIEEGKKLSIHHIDYDKKNCLPSNLIALCHKCNSKVNNNREKWPRYFRRKLNHIENIKNNQLCFHL